LFKENNCHPIPPLHQSFGRYLKELDKETCHFIFTGVTLPFHYTYCSSGIVSKDAVVLAKTENENGQLAFAAELKKFEAKIISLDFFLPSNDSGDGSWDAEVPAPNVGGIIMANSLLYVAYQ